MSDAVSFNINQRFVVDEGVFRGASINILQRQVADVQKDYYLKFIVPMARKYGSWVAYNIDDCIHKDDIPMWNRAQESYDKPGYMENVKEMLNASDFVLVTTPELGKYYHDRFGVSEEAVVVIPNYLPLWWIGAYFNQNLVISRYEKFHSRPRIGIIGAPGHYDVTGKKLANDITGIADYVRKTVKQYQWVVFGSDIPELHDLILSKEIEFYGGTDILHYPSFLNSLGLQMVVAPLKDCIFNRCKSNIKQTESWALGIGCLCQNLPCYARYSKDVFDGPDDLDMKLRTLLSSKESFQKMVEENYRRMGAWWLENHIGEWMSLYNIRQKPLVYDYDRAKYLESVRKTAKIGEETITMPDFK
jgi:DNA-binding protein Fis